MKPHTVFTLLKVCFYVWSFVAGVALIAFILLETLIFYIYAGSLGFLIIVFFFLRLEALPKEIAKSLEPIYTWFFNQHGWSQMLVCFLCGVTTLLIDFLVN